MIYTNEDIKKKINNRDKIKKVFEIIIMPVVIVLILFSCYVGYLKFIKKSDDINILGFRQYIVLTGSMEPNYNVGDIIVIKEKPENQIAVGDVVNYTTSSNGKTVTHRVIEIVNENGKTLFKTKGDNNNSADPELVSYNQIKGTIIFKISKLGAFVTNILTGTGVTVILILFILSYIHSNKIEEKRINRETARRLYNVPKY